MKAAIGKVKLRNIYNNTDFVFCEDVLNVKVVNGTEFLRVYKEENSDRKFLVNKNAYTIVERYK